MSEMNPQADPAADALNGSGPLGAPDSDGADELGSGGEPQGAPPRAKNPREETFQRKWVEHSKQAGRLLGSDYLKTLGGDGIVKALEQFEAILSHPETGASVKEHLSQSADGRWQYKPISQQKAASVDSEAGFDTTDPLVTQFKQLLDERLSPLQDRLTALQSRSELALSAGSEQKVADMTRRFLANYPPSEEERGEVAEAMRRRIDSLDPSNVLRLSDEQFEDMIGLPAVKRFLPKILARKQTKRGSQLADLATDANGTASLGAEQAHAKFPAARNISQINRILGVAAEKAARESA